IYTLPLHDALPISWDVHGSSQRRSVLSVCVRDLRGSALMLRRGCLSLVCHDLQVVDIGAELRVDEESRRALSIADWIRLVDHPRRRLDFARRPGFAARA